MEILLILVAVNKFLLDCQITALYRIQFQHSVFPYCDKVQYCT